MLLSHVYDHLHTGLTKISTKVPRCISFRKGRDQHTDRSQELMHSDNRTTDLIAITKPARNQCDDGCERVWRCSEQLALCPAEAHALAQNDGQEVRVRITW